MAIEVIPKQKIKETQWQNIALYVILAIFLLFLLSYLVLAFYESRLEKEISELTAALARTDSERTLEKDVLSFQKSAKDFVVLLSNHVFPTRIFELLEKNTHPKVRFSELKLDLQGGTLELHGNAESFDILAKQLKIFEEQEFIKNVKLSKVSADKTGVNIELRLSFDTRVLK
jgi:Tfp pilus assembly protein PilN